MADVVAKERTERVGEESIERYSVLEINRYFLINH